MIRQSDHLEEDELGRLKRFVPSLRASRGGDRQRK